MENPRLMGPAMRKCDYCDEPFPVSRLNKKYCNDLCRIRAWRIKNV